MFKHAASFQNSTRHASFSAVLAERQKRRPKGKFNRGRHRKRLEASGTTITFSKKEAREAEVLLDDLRAAVKTAKEFRASRMK